MTAIEIIEEAQLRNLGAVVSCQPARALTVLSRLSGPFTQTLLDARTKPRRRPSRTTSIVTRCFLFHKPYQRTILTHHIRYSRHSHESYGRQNQDGGPQTLQAGGGPGHHPAEQHVLEPIQVLPMDPKDSVALFRLRGGRALCVRNRSIFDRRQVQLPGKEERRPRLRVLSEMGRRKGWGLWYGANKQRKGQ